MNRQTSTCEHTLSTSLQPGVCSPRLKEDCFSTFVAQQSQLKKWFATFTDGQKQVILNELIELCPTALLNEFQVLIGGMQRRIQCDFTVLLPYNLLVYLFTFCDAKSLKALSQVSWYCKILADSNDVWYLKCKRRGWLLRNIGRYTQLPLGFWKQFYLEKQRIASRSSYIQPRHECMLNECSIRCERKGDWEHDYFEAGRMERPGTTSNSRMPTSSTPTPQFLRWKTTTQTAHDRTKRPSFRVHTPESSSQRQQCRSCNPQINANSASKHQQWHSTYQPSELKSSSVPRRLTQRSGCQPGGTVSRNRELKLPAPWLPSSKTLKGRTQSLESRGQIAARWKAVRRTYSVKNLFHHSNAGHTSRMRIERESGSLVRAAHMSSDSCDSDGTRYADVFGVPCTMDLRTTSQYSPLDFLLKTEDKLFSNYEMHSWSRNKCNMYSKTFSDQENSAGDNEIHSEMLDHSGGTYSIHPKHGKQPTCQNQHDKWTLTAPTRSEVALSPIFVPLEVQATDVQTQWEPTSPKAACDRTTSISELSHGINFHRISVHHVSLSESSQGTGAWPRKQKAPQVKRPPVFHRATSVTLQNRDIGISRFDASYYNMDPTLRDDSQATLVTSCTDLVSTASGTTRGYDSDLHNLSALDNLPPCSRFGSSVESGSPHPCTIRNNQVHDPALLPSELTVTCDLQELQSLRNSQGMMQEAVVIQGIVRGC